MDLDKSNPSNLDLDMVLILSLDWILDSKYFMDLDSKVPVPWIWIWTWISFCPWIGFWIQNISWTWIWISIFKRLQIQESKSMQL